MAHVWSIYYLWCFLGIVSRELLAIDVLLLSYEEYRVATFSILCKVYISLSMFIYFIFCTVQKCSSVVSFNKLQQYVVDFYCHWPLTVQLSFRSFCDLVKPKCTENHLCLVSTLGTLLIFEDQFLQVRECLICFDKSKISRACSGIMKLVVILYVILSETFWWVSALSKIQEIALFCILCYSGVAHSGPLMRASCSNIIVIIIIIIIS